MLKPFGPAIWTANGPVVSTAGFHYPTLMVVIRLDGGDLFIWSPIALTDDLKTSVNALGTVRHLVAPNSLHHLYLDQWQSAFPNALIYAPPGLRKKRPDLRFDADLGDSPASDWAGQIDQVMVSGNLITTEIVFFHLPSKTAIFADLIQHFPKTWHKGWRRIVARLDLMAADQPSVPRKFRAAFTKRSAARMTVNQIKKWPAANLLMAHGAPVLKNGQASITAAFRWLTG